MNLATTVIRCSPVELAYLAGVVGDGPIIGVPDPFAGRLASEVEEALTLARSGLQSRGLLQIGPDGTVTAEAEIGALLQICVGSRPSFRLVRTLPESGTTIHHFHRTEAGSVELASGTAEDAVDLIAVSSLPERVMQLLKIAEQTAPTDTEGTVTEALLERARDLAEDGRAEEGAVLLSQAGIPIEPAALLASDLEAPLLTAALITVQPAAAGWGADGVALVEGAGGLWLLRPAAGQVTITRVGARDVERVVRQVVGE